MADHKRKKPNLLAESATNKVAKVQVAGAVYNTSTSGSINKVEAHKSIRVLEKALEEGVFSDLKANGSED